MSQRAQNHYSNEPIAIVGASCRLPGNVVDLPSFWELLATGTDAITELPPGRCDFDRFFSSSQTFEGHAYIKAAGIIPDIKHFDPTFFGMSHKEAQYLDPTQRLLLETTWEALEHAFIVPSTLRGTDAGVFVGASSMDMSLQGPDDPAKTSAHSMTGCTLSIIANRLSYLFDLHGPSLTVDTACSSSLVALHLACEALRNGSTSLAIAGGVNLLLAPYPFIGFSRARMLSPDGRCKVFDATGNGYVRSEGAGVVILKPLRKALHDGDRVLALIAGTGVNSDGKTTGIALPNSAAQAKLLKTVYKRFSLHPQSLAYVEAHGTGTAAGDPLEAAAIGTVLGKPLRRTRPLLVGSVKSNIGHLEPAAGIAGLIKALLILQHNLVPPNLHFHTPNPAIDFEKLNIAVPTSPTPLPDLGGNELISVNSFGFGGTNAHLVLQRFTDNSSRSYLPSNQQTQYPQPPLLLSARSHASLTALASACAEQLEQTPAHQQAETMYHMAATLAYSREQMKVRFPVCGTSVHDTITTLRSLETHETADNPSIVPDAAGENISGVFAFSGNGSQWAGMAQRLLTTNATFRATVEEVDTLLRPLQNWSLLDALSAPDLHPTAFTLTEKSQPLLFAVQAGLVRSLAEKGITPQGVIGHSVGEVAAAWACGALTLPDAATVIHYRSLFQKELLHKGCMAVVQLPESTAKALLAFFGNSVEIAAINTDQSLTLAGATEALHTIIQHCQQHGITAKMLDLPYPFHTRQMDSVKDGLLDSLKHICPQKPTIPFYSTAVPSHQPPVFDNMYWWLNIRMPVLFYKGMTKALNNGHKIFLEIGPHPILANYMRSIVKQQSARVAIVSSLSKTLSADDEIEAVWKSTWQHGWTITPDPLFPLPHQRIELPPYAWNREYLWAEDTPENRGHLTAPRVHPLLGWQLPGKAPVYENTLHPSDTPWLCDHKAGNNIPYPAAAFIESMLAAAFQNTHGFCALEWVSITRPLLLNADGAKNFRLSIDHEDGGITVEAKPHMSPEPWVAYARGRSIPPTRQTLAVPDLEHPERFGASISSNRLYKIANQFMLHYGPAFQTVAEAWVHHDPTHPEVLSRLVLTNTDSGNGMIIPPTLLDGAFQTLFLLLAEQSQLHTHPTYLPSVFERITLHAQGTPAFAHARLERVSPRSVVASFSLYDSNRDVLVHLQNCRFRRSAWLEHEKTPSAAYAMHLHDAPSPKIVTSLTNLSFPQVTKQVKACFTMTPAEEDAYANTALLVQFTSLAAMHETILQLCRAQNTPLHIDPFQAVASGTLPAEYEASVWYQLEQLEKSQLAERHGTNWHISPQSHLPAMETMWRTLLSASPKSVPEATLLSAVFSLYSAIAQNTSDHTPISLSEKLKQNYYRHSPALQPYNAAILPCITNVLQAKSQHEHIHILQWANDAEGVLTLVLPLLKQTQCHYTVACATAEAAETLSIRFDSHPHIHFCALSDTTLHVPHEHKARYDLIISAHHIHQCPDTDLAIQHYHTMLVPGGMLYMTELTPNLFTDYIFGSSPTWWSTSQEAHIPISLLRTQDQWLHALKHAGFEKVVAAQKSSNTPASLLLARKTAKNTNSQASAPAAQSVHAESPEPQEHQLIITNPDADITVTLGNTISQFMKDRGYPVTNVPSNDDSTKSPPVQSGNTHANEGYWVELLQRIAPTAPVHAIYLAGYSTTTPAKASQLAHEQTLALANLMALAQACEQLRPPIRISVITGGALPLSTPDNVFLSPSPSQGALAGFTRVLRQEMRFMNVALIDIHGHQHTMDAIMHDLLPIEQELHPAVAQQEPEVVFFKGRRYVPRLQPIHPPQLSHTHSGATLVTDTPGRLQNLYWKLTDIPVPASDEVCIKIHATGLNFRDIMWSTGMLLDEALENGFSGPTMGLECAGTIVAIGDNVQGWNVGDEVIGFAPSCLSSHTVTKATAIASKPASLSFTEAATIPVAFMTAWYSLHHLAALQPGEKVLIHGAAGGVGLAAIQIATHLGLEIYATAGSPEKHQFLKRLGIKNLYSSRSVQFSSDILSATQGEGVDAVLNCLAGEAIAASLKVLRPFGRFIELGKRDFYADTPMRLRPFSNNLTYFGVDVDQLLIHQPQLAQRLFSELLQHFAEGSFAPLPHTTFEAQTVIDAFQTMQQANHIGKIVITPQDAPSLAIKPASDLRTLSLDPNASYLITGGTTGFGLATAQHFANHGARHLILVSRSGCKTTTDQHTITSLQKKGVHVSIVKADVAHTAQLKKKIRDASANMPPIRGIVHAAAILDDGMISGLTPKRLATSLSAKAMGAWNLHTISADMPLDFFVLYSSATTIFGNPGQAGYVAGNCMLEALAAYRTANNLPATVIGWGPIDDTGMLTRNEKARKMLLTILGVSPTHTDQALRWLDHCIVENIHHSYYFGLDWQNKGHLPALSGPCFSYLRTRPALTVAHEGITPDHIRNLPVGEALSLLTTILIDEIAAVLRLPKSQLAAETPLVSLGMDSLMAVELTLAIEQKFDLSGYALPLSEKTTAASLTESLYSTLATGSVGDSATRQSSQEHKLLSTLEQQHGVALSENQRRIVLQTLKE